MTYRQNGHGLLSVGSTDRPQKSKSFNTRNIPHERYLNKAIADILASAADARKGGRNTALNRAAYSYGQLLEHTSRDRAEAELLAVAQVCRLEVIEAKATIRSGLDAGAKKPRELSPNGRGRNANLPRRWLVRHWQDEQPQPVKSGSGQKSKADYARKLWQQSQPATGTLAEIYLQGRGIICPIPGNMRFLPSLKHNPTGTTWPALLVLIERQPGGGLQAIQRLFLQPNGKGKAPVKPVKMSLGNIRGGAVWIGQPDDALTICEGLEDALSLFMTGYPTAAACGAFNLKNLTIPTKVRKIIIAADHGEAGEREADKAAQTYLQQGYEVRVAFPPDDMDWNDMLQTDGWEVEA